MPRRIFFVSLFLFFIIYFTAFISQLSIERSYTSVLTFHTCSTEAFRRQELRPYLYTSLIEETDSKDDWINRLTSLMLDSDFRPDSSFHIIQRNSFCQKFKPREYQFLKNCYQAIWKDLIFFPVSSDKIFFSNDWLKKSGCNGNSSHQGTDLWGYSHYPGYFPVISCSDGTVIQSGWTADDGYQLLIQSPSGGFFYYSMLSSFERNWSRGNSVSAGDILGYMGNSRHIFSHAFKNELSCLHFGIFINDIQKQKVSVNPYWILRVIHKKIRNYTY